jgi:hypothetical protein
MTPDRASRPIFLIGTGRCGSSLLLRLLGGHPDLAWFSHWSARFGASFAALARVHRLPGGEDWLPNPASRLVPQPTESYAPLRQATGGLFTAPRELDAAEATPEITARLRAMAHRHVVAQGAERFLMKHTGFPRVAFLRAAFPDATFVHVVRDGRAVATSLCKVDWWSGEAQWGWGPLSEADRAAYADSGYHELVLAGLYWRALMARYDDVRAATPPDQLLEVRYDALIADPVGALRGLCAFADLPWSEVLERRIRAVAVTSDDVGWRRRVTDAEAAMLERLLGPSLAAHGFTAAAA